MPTQSRRHGTGSQTRYLAFGNPTQPLPNLSVKTHQAGLRVLRRSRLHATYTRRRKGGPPSNRYSRGLASAVGHPLSVGTSQLSGRTDCGPRSFVFCPVCSVAGRYASVLGRDGPVKTRTSKARACPEPAEGMASPHKGGTPSPWRLTCIFGPPAVSPGGTRVYGICNRDILFIFSVDTGGWFLYHNLSAARVGQQTVNGRFGGFLSARY